MKSFSNELSNIFLSNIRSTVNSYNQKLIKKHPSIQQSDLLSIWKDIEISLTLTSSPSHHPPPPPVIKKQTNASGCPYKYTRGSKKGTVCGMKASRGMTYCCRHKKYDQNPISKPAPPVVKSVRDRVLRKNPKINDRLWHPISGLVFDSPLNLIVIGKVDSLGLSIVPLTDKSIEVCKDWGFKYDKSCIFRSKEVGKCEYEEHKESVNEKSEEYKETETTATPSPIGRFVDTSQDQQRRITQTSSTCKKGQAKNEIDEVENVKKSIMEVLGM